MRDRCLEIAGGDHHLTKTHAARNTQSGPPVNPAVIRAPHAAPRRARPSTRRTPDRSTGPPPHACCRPARSLPHARRPARDGDAGRTAGRRGNAVVRAAACAVTGRVTASASGPYAIPTAGAFLGRGGLFCTRVGGKPDVEVAYAFMPECWGRGLATELATESVRVGVRRARASRRRLLRPADQRGVAAGDGEARLPPRERGDRARSAARVLQVAGVTSTRPSRSARAATWGRPDVAAPASCPGGIVDAGDARQQLAQRDLRLEPRQRRADAVVDAHAEGDVAVVPAIEEELVGPREDGLVAVGRAQEDEEPGVGGNRPAAQRHLARRAPERRLEGGVVPQGLLDRGGQQRRGRRAPAAGRRDAPRTRASR